MYVCMYVYIYVYIYMYINIYVGVCVYSHSHTHTGGGEVRGYNQVRSGHMGGRGARKAQGLARRRSGWRGALYVCMYV